MLALLIGAYTLPFAIQKGKYAFTWEMAAGLFADDPYIDTGDCRIYYNLLEGDWENGRNWQCLHLFRVVEKHLWRFTVWDEHESAQHIFNGNTAVGRLYTVKGKNGYYNLIRSYISNQIPEYLVTVESVRILGVEYEVQDGFFFITPEPVEYFFIEELYLNVE